MVISKIFVFSSTLHIGYHLFASYRQDKFIEINVFVYYSYLAKLVEQKRVRCIVPNCNEKSATSDLKFFKLPEDAQRRSTWLDCIGVAFENLKVKYNFICEKHFAPHHIGYSRLTRNAVPSLYIHSSPDNEPSSSGISAIPMKLHLESETKCEPILQLNDRDKDTEFLRLINQVICTHCDTDREVLECNGCNKKSVQLNLYKKKK